LIVDDQPANVGLLERTLREGGYLHVSSTMVPQEVCALHRRHRYDLILLDLQMPGMDGFQVMEGLRAGDCGGPLPVLVITAQPGHKLRALQCGARDFISKPFELVEVRTRVRNLLETCLLHRRLENHAAELVEAVAQRTAELRASESSYRSLTELASDWYWEQDASGSFTRVSGPVLEMLGVRVDGLAADAQAQGAGWNEAERRELQAAIAARIPFLDFVFTRTHSDGSQRKFQVSGEPMFGTACQLVGYRGLGFEVAHHRESAP
jgi:CheY-like chemotaxis protein